ncbi:MAG: protein kinase [Nitrospira sp.]|nr:serine/threonine protein kinase [Candidatus Manganitrophaceae bacterium]HIL35263.1 serine/threonine protein kinase [Candidatus Manganitrophaceae bacterium]
MNDKSWNDTITRFLDNPVLFIEQFISSFSTTSLIGYVFFLILIVSGYKLAKKYFAMRRAIIPDPINEAMLAERSQDPFRAGELYENAGQYDKAIRAYKEARAFQEIGRIFEHLREWEEAAQFYKLTGNIEKSAIMYQKGGKYLQAAKAYLQCKKNTLAAEMYERGRRYREAAEVYRKFGNIEKSATLYEQSGDYGKAAEEYEAHFLRQNIANTGQPSDKREQILQAGYKSGQLYLKVGLHLKAMEIFSAADFPNQAAEAAVLAGEKEKAAKLFLTAGTFKKAAKLFEELGDKKRSHWIMAKQYQEDSDLLSAAKAFELGENWIEAGEMYERVGEKGRAGKMYMNGGDYHRSAEMFHLAGDRESAAMSLEKGGDLREAAVLYTKLEMFKRASQLYELLGDYYSAALLLKEVGESDQCISYLQKVDSHSGDYYPASIILVKLLKERGMESAGAERLQKIVAQRKISPHNIELYYQYAILHEGNKKFEEAASVYENILAEDLKYKDVKQRNDLLKKVLREVKKAKPLLKDKESDLSRKTASPSDSSIRYKIIKKIGQGGMGVVYQAEDTLLKRIVAYKVLPVAIKENKAMLKNFLQEARIAAALNHPSIVTLYDTGKNGDEIYITMEYVDGITLKKFLEKRLHPVRISLRIMKSICTGIAYAHRENVVHRDLKPANIMLIRNHGVKIMDFGLAKLITDDAADKTSVKGTPLYMSPEQILGNKVDQQSDIYSLGCTFYRMVTGRPPFTKGDIYYHHLHTPPVSPKEANPTLPDRLEQIIMKCLEKKKINRYSKIENITKELDLVTE